jgi:hypothetical protein
MENVIRYKTPSGKQEELREAFKWFKDPEPVIESYEAPDGTKVTRVLTDVLNPDALQFWTKYSLPPIPTINGDGVVRDYSPVLKPQPSPSCELKDSIDNASEVCDILSH